MATPLRYLQGLCVEKIFSIIGNESLPFSIVLDKLPEGCLAQVAHGRILVRKVSTSRMFPRTAHLRQRKRQTDLKFIIILYEPIWLI